MLASLPPEEETPTQLSKLPQDTFLDVYVKSLGVTGSVGIGGNLFVGGSIETEGDFTMHNGDVTGVNELAANGIPFKVVGYDSKRCIDCTDAGESFAYTYWEVRVTPARKGSCD